METRQENFGKVEVTVVKNKTCFACRKNVYLAKRIYLAKGDRAAKRQQNCQSIAGRNPYNFSPLKNKPAAKPQQAAFKCFVFQHAKITRHKVQLP